MRAVALVLMSCVVGCGDDGGASLDAPRPPSKYVYLNFEGVTLSMGSNNAEANTAAFLQVPTQDFPPFLPDANDRGERLDLITSNLTTLVAPYDIGVVRERPTDAPYMMIVFSDISANLGFPTGLGGFLAACTEQTSAVAVQFAYEPSFDARDVAAYAHSYLAMAAIGWSAGIPFTTQPRDCMCWAGAECTWPFTQRCTLGGPETPVDPNTSMACPGTTYPATIDVGAMFLENLGAHP